MGETLRPGAVALAHRAVGRVAWRVLLIVCVCASVVAIVAVVDHRHKQQQIDRAELAQWYCAQFGAECGGVRAEKIERRWNERQAVYEGVVCFLVLLGAAAVFGFTLRRD